jgi:vitamin B12 transporter
MSLKIRSIKENENQVYFKNWIRKKCAILNSMGKAIKICILLVTYSIISQPRIISAQTDTVLLESKIDIEEVEVIGQRSPVISSDISRIVTVITKSEIQSAPAQSVQDILEYFAGIDVRQRGVFGIQADVNIRGSTFDQVLILLNGINISDPQTGHFSLYLPLEIESIERVEILNGPAARVLGINAFAGAINFVTGKKSGNNLNFTTTIGDNGFIRLNTSGTISAGKLTNFLSASKSGSDGYIPLTGFKRYNLFYHGEIKSENIDLGFQIGYDNRDFEANSFYSIRYPEQYEISKTTFCAVKASTGNKIKISPSVYWRRLHDSYEMVVDTSLFFAYNLIDIFGVNLNSFIYSKLGTTALGFEYRTENIFSNNRGLDMSKPIKMPGYDDVILDKSYIRSNTGYFFEHSLNIGSLFISGGFMLNWNSTFRNKIKIYPGIDISYNIIEGVKIFGTVNQTFRLPTFTDMLYKDPVTSGNMNLDPEKALSMETGIKINTREITGHISYYHRAGKDYIDYVLNPDTGMWYAENINKVTANGADLSLSLRMNKIIKYKLPVQNLNLNYSFIDIRKSSGEIESRYVLDNLKHKFSLTSVINLAKYTKGSVYVIYQDRSGNYDVFDTDSTAYIHKPYKPFWLLNVKLQQDIKSITLFLEVNNMLNKKYRDVSNIIQPGRWIIGGFKINLDFRQRSKPDQ